MFVGVLEVSFQIPAANSLKDKRKIVKSIKDRIQHRFNISLAETEGQSTWQLCSLAAAMVANQKIAIERDLNRIIDLIESVPEINLTDQFIEYY